MIIVHIKDNNLATSAIIKENIRKNWKKVQCVKSRQGKKKKTMGAERKLNDTF